MSFQFTSVPLQNGRVAIVTGGNAGLGFETARMLAQTGMTVVLACRSTERAETARADILEEFSYANVDVMPLELGRMQSIRGFATDFLAQYDRLDLLVNNAGVMMTPYSHTEDGFEKQIGINFLGHFLLTGLLLPRLESSHESTADSRVVTVASLAHRHASMRLQDFKQCKRYNRWKAYAQSKLACLMFAYELQRRLDAWRYSTQSIAAHPGVAVSELARHLVPGPLLKHVAPSVIKIAGQSARDGALPIIYAALGTDIEGGDYTGPVSLSEWRGRPGRVDSSALSKDVQLAERLWQHAEELTAISYPKTLS